MDWNNRKFQYGDGFFETLIVKNGQIQYWNDHQERILHACKTLKIKLNSSFTNDLEKSILSKSVYNNSRIKVQFWRSGNGRYTPETNDIGYQVEVSENSTDFFRTAEQIKICDTSEVIPSKYSSFKCFLLPYIVAGLEKVEKECDDLIITNTNHHVTECISSNLFWVTNNKIYTPSLKTGCLNGVMRKQIMNILDINEVVATISEIEQAQSIFCSNVTGITQFKKFRNQEMQTIDLENALHGI